jgi:hypothetical protein
MELREAQSCCTGAEGELGLMDLAVQAKVLGARVLLWTIQPGDHPLQRWVQDQLRALSLSMFSIFNSSCLFVNRSSLKTKFSPTLHNLYTNWLQHFKFLELSEFTIGLLRSKYMG